MKPWICSECRAPIKHPMDVWVISEDALRSDGKKRAYRIRITVLCTTHMREREHSGRPRGIEGQEGLF